MKRTTKIHFFIILIVACLGGFSSDIYTPALPAISHALNTTISLVQWTMAIYLFGMAATLAVFGALSEGFGRKAPLLVGLVIMLVGTIICFFARNIDTLMVGRFIQGCGAGAGAGVWRAMFRDLFAGEQLAKFGSYFGIAVTIVIPIAPAIGGFLQHALSWQAIFVFIGLYVILTWFTVRYFFQETNKHHDKSRLKPRYLLDSYLEIFRHRAFIGASISTFITYGAFFSWFAIGPVILIHLLHLSALQFGLITFIGSAIACFIGSLANARLVERMGIINMMRFGWTVMIIAAVAMITLFYIVGLNCLAIVIPAFVFYFGSTFIWPGTNSTALTPFGKKAGYAGSMYSLIQLAGGAVFAAFAAYLPEHNQLGLGLILLFATVIAWIIFEVVANHKKG